MQLEQVRDAILDSQRDAAANHEASAVAFEAIAVGAVAPRHHRDRHGGHAADLAFRARAHPVMQALVTDELE